MTATGYATDPRYRLASLGAQAVYRCLRGLRDEADVVAAVPGHTLAVSVAAAMGARADEVATHLAALAALALVAPAGPEAVRLVPRPGSRARAADGTPRVALTAAEKQRAYRQRRATQGVTSGNVVTPTSGNAPPVDGVTVEGNATGNALGNAPSACGNADANGVENTTPNDGAGVTVVGNALGNAGNAKDGKGGQVSPLPLASPSSLPPTPKGENTLPAGARGSAPLALTAPETATPKRGRPAARADVLPAEGTPAWAVWDAITRDAGLAPIVANPGDFAARVTDPRRFPGVDVLAVVLDAAEFLARGTTAYSDGRAFLNNQLRRAAERAAAAARPDTSRAVARAVAPRGIQPPAPAAAFAEATAAGKAIGRIPGLERLRAAGAK